MDIVERLRDGTEGTLTPLGELHMEAADEIERLRYLLQNGSPVVEGTIQHMAMQLAAVKQECDALRQLAESKMDEVAACQKDAERYRFIRSKGELILYNTIASQVEMENLDAAIDAAMKEQS